jgi:hypothetical protein
MLKRNWRIGASLAAIGVVIAPIPSASQHIPTRASCHSFALRAAEGANGMLGGAEDGTATDGLLGDFSSPPMSQARQKEFGLLANGNRGWLSNTLAFRNAFDACMARGRFRY